MAVLDTVDAPMLCCGMIMGSGFNNAVLTGKMIPYQMWGGATVERPETRYPNEADQRTRLQYLIDTASENNRNCAMISLSSDQSEIIAIAKDMGFKEIHSFYNPNSGNTVHLMVYEHFSSYEEYVSEEEPWE